MSLINCPECHNCVSDKAVSCPQCGCPINSSGVGFSSNMFFGYEYKSKTTLGGVPLVHVSSGITADGRPRVARGIIAIGNIAIGVLAFGGIALGGIALGGVSLGLVALGGLALGILFGMGGAATGYIAIGGLAIGVYAIGGASVGVHTIWNDPSLKEYLAGFIGKCGGCPR